MRPLFRIVTLAATLIALASGAFAASDPFSSAPASVAGRLIDNDSRLWVSVEAPSREDRSAVAAAGVSIEEIAAGKAAGFATPEAIEALRKTGLAFRTASLSRRFVALDFPKEDAAFHNYSELAADMASVAASAKDLATFFSIGKSLNGRELMAIRLNTTARGMEPSSKPGIVFLGTHHAREHLSTEVPFLLVKHLIENRSKPEVAKLLATRDVYFIPLVNPDGAEYDIDGDIYHMHRKNMRGNANGSIGVDLNRNYGFHWGEGGASPSPNSDTYRGPAPFSEPESQAVKAFVESRKNLKILLSYHTYSELILYPWGHSYNPLPDAKALSAYKAMAQKMASWTGYTPQQSSQLYIASGDTTDWAWGELGIFSFTFELTPKSWGNGGFYPGAAAIASTFQTNIKPALYLIDMAEDPYRSAAAPSL
jgi:carboxypeptidase T